MNESSNTFNFNSFFALRPSNTNMREVTAYFRIACGRAPEDYTRGRRPSTTTAAATTGEDMVSDKLSGFIPPLLLSPPWRPESHRRLLWRSFG